MYTNRSLKVQTQAWTRNLHHWVCLYNSQKPKPAADDQCLPNTWARKSCKESRTQVGKPTKPHKLHHAGSKQTFIYEYSIISIPLKWRVGKHSVPMNRHESTNTNRNEPRGHGTGKWKRTAGTEPQMCRNRTENHSYILIWCEKECKNDYLSIYLLYLATLQQAFRSQTSFFSSHEPVTPQEALSGPNIAFRGLRKIRTAEQPGLRNSLFEENDLANLVNPHTHVVYSTVRSRNPPRSTFGAKHSFPGVTENQYSRTV